MTAGSNPRPTRDTQVALTREELLIEIRANEVRVQAAYWLQNHGPATSFQVGFPCDVDPEESVGTLPCTTRVQVTVDGRARLPKQRPTTKTVHDWVWPMRMDAGGRAKLDIAYRVPAEEGTWLMEALVYRLRTGTAWAGPIGQLEIEVRTPADSLAFIAPPGYTRSSGRIRWSLANVEPVQDLVLLYAGTAGFADVANGSERYAEWESIYHIEHALESLHEEPTRLMEAYIPLRFFGSEWPTSAEAFRRCLDESAALLDTRLPSSWLLFKQQLAASGSKLPSQDAQLIYLKQRGYLLQLKANDAGDGDGLARIDRMARDWLDRLEHDAGIGVDVAVANALAGDFRGAGLLRDAVADGPPLAVARGLAILHIPVCPLVEEQLPDEWASYVKKTTPPPVEPGSFGLSRALVQRETRLRLLQLMSEGTDGDCLAFVIEVARSPIVSIEERTLAQAILRRGQAATAAPPTLEELERRLRNRDVQIRLAGLKTLAERRDAPAVRFRAALRHSDFCESRLLAGATWEDATEARVCEGCLDEHLGPVYTALLSVGHLASAAVLLQRPMDRSERRFVERLGEWLAARRTR